MAAAYLAAAWVDSRDTGLIAGLAAISLTAVIRRAATGSVLGLLVISAVRGWGRINGADPDFHRRDRWDAGSCSACW